MDQISYSESSTTASLVDLAAPEAGIEQTSLAELILAFSAAIALPGGKALLIAENNSGDRWVAIPQAVAERRTFAVDVAAQILAIDLDDPERQGALHEIAEQCRAAGATPVLVRSGRPGHMHLLARIEKRNLLTQLQGTARRAGLDVRATIRPPLVPHRLGFQSTLADPSTAAEALRALRPAETCFRPLSRRMRTLLRDGDVQGRYRSRSEVLQALALAAVNAGWSFDQWWPEIRDRRNVGGAKVHAMADKKNERTAQEYARQSWRRAERRAAQSPPMDRRSDDHATIARLARAAVQFAWQGKAGATDCAVLHGHLTIARRVRSLTFGASVREVAELAGVSAPTVRKSRQRLQAGEWLQPLPRDEPGTNALAGNWMLLERKSGRPSKEEEQRPEEGDPPHSVPSLGGVCTTVEDVGPAPDAFRWGGLGKSAELVWRRLSADGVGLEALAASLRRPVLSVRKILKRLNQFGLASCDINGAWIRTDGDLESVARAVGTDGVGMRQRERHREERESYYQTLDARSHRRGRPRRSHVRRS